MQDLSQGNHVAILLPNVEEVREMRRFRPIPNAFLWNDAAISVLQRINTGSAHTSTCGATGDDQRIDAHAREGRLKMRPEKTGGIFFIN